MAIPVWTGRTPLAEFSRQPTDPFTRTEMDNGMARHRVRFRVYPITSPCSFLCQTQAEYDQWIEFCRDELQLYSGWFMLRTAGPGGVRLRRVRWVAAPAEEWLGAGRWKVSGQIETLNNS